MIAKQCPLLQRANLQGVCDYPALLERFPARMREHCASDGRCLLRRVKVLGSDDTGEGINIVQAQELTREYSHRGQSIPTQHIDTSIWWHIRSLAVP